eukprot:scaffold6383_cov112-Isochrysis_galbana.AAC.1
MNPPVAGVLVSGAAGGGDGEGEAKQEYAPDCDGGGSFAAGSDGEGSQTSRAVSAVSHSRSSRMDEATRLSCCLWPWPMIHW